MEKLLEVNTRIQMMPTMKAGHTGNLNTATRTMGISGVSMASAPVTPVSCLVGWAIPEQERRKRTSRRCA